ncbi:MAG: MarR family transcriptional regulator [Candidatus Methanoperedens sp.]|nr:MarR family transcriptional regulator [Candidatus Methanoperedens sp.]MCZ7396020.1 MarR family transcriptional regulator [Candidatus Methanoperedens sp.]
MALNLNIRTHGILISAIVLIISVLLLIDRLLATGPVQLILQDGTAVPIEGASYFSLNEVLFFIITAWLGGMSFLYIVLFPKEKEIPELKRDLAGLQEIKSTAILAANILEGDEKILFQKIIDNDGILQRELVLKAGFSEPKVSRLLDRLERRGLIVRQRDGMGNRVLIK